MGSLLNFAGKLWRQGWHVELLYVAEVLAA